MIDGGRPLAILDQILEHYRVVQHGVSMYFGSAETLNREHLRRLKALVKRTKTPWLTDHLCWGSVDGRYTHDLLPMPYTFEAAEHHRAEDSRGSRFSGSSYRRRKRQQLCRISCLGNDGMGIPERSCRARRLRHSARRQQYLCFFAESQFRSYRLREQRARRSRCTDPYRRPFEISRSTFSTRTIIRSSIPSGSFTRRHPARRPYRHAARMGRSHSLASMKFIAKHGKPTNISPVLP